MELMKKLIKEGSSCSSNDGSMGGGRWLPKYIRVNVAPYGKGAEAMITIAEANETIEKMKTWGWRRLEKRGAVGIIAKEDEQRWQGTYDIALSGGWPPVRQQAGGVGHSHWPGDEKGPEVCRSHCEM